MMKRILHPVSITLIVVIGIFSLPLFLQKKIPVLTDAQLREAATNHNLHPVPKTYIVDPEKPIPEPNHPF